MNLLEIHSQSRILGLIDLYGFGCAVLAPMTVPAVIRALLFTPLLYVIAHVHVKNNPLAFS